MRCLVRDVQRAKHLEELGAKLTLGRLDEFDSLVRGVADVDVVFHVAVGTYHVAAERTIMYGELGHLVAQAIGCRVAAVPVPRFLFWVAGGAMEVIGRILGRPGLLNLDKVREAMAPGWECSDEKIRAELGYRPAATLEERFAETVAWYREHGWL